MESKQKATGRSWQALAGACQSGQELAKVNM